MKKNRNTLIDFTILVLVTIIAYFPVSFFIFSLKNDSLVQYLPFRYHVSESIQHGYFPFWNPYLYTGFPVHADMQGMTWNPVVLFISLFTRYNMSVLQLEVMLYLFLAAIGMYSLLKSFSFSRVICILGGISYVSCGFINGSASVIPWVSSAAFIPFVFVALKKYAENPKLKTSLLFGISLSMLFLCGYPTFFIYTCYIIFAIILFILITYFKSKPSPVSIKNFGLLLLAAIIFLLICSPAIISYWEFLPYYSRGSGVTVAKASQNPFTPFSSISFLLPNAVNKNNPLLETDPSMRNSYVGLFVFLLFIASLFSKYNKWQKLFFGITVFSFVLSLGPATPLHKLCYAILPLFDTFRHPGNIRLFTSLGIIVLAAFFAEKIINRPKEKVVKKIKLLTFILIPSLGIIAIYFLLRSDVRNNITLALKTIMQPKEFLDTFSFNAFLAFQCIAQIFFLTVLLFLLSKKVINKRAIGILIALNSIVFCWISLPFNFISKTKTSTINQYVRSFPNGYPLPDINAPAEAAVISDSIEISLYGYANFYSKKITIQDNVTTPTLNKDYESFCADKKLRTLMATYPFVWLNDTLVNKTPDTITNNKKFSVYTELPATITNSLTGHEKISLIKFSPNQFTFTISCEKESVMSIFQQYNRNWKVKVNGKPVPILKMNIAFMGVQIPAGESKVEFIYKPLMVINAIWLSLATIIIILLFFILKIKKQK